MNNLIRLAACSLLLFCSFTKASHQKLAIIFMGDSITQGVGLDATQAPPATAYAYLSARLPQGSTYSNQGHSGYTTLDFLPKPRGASQQVTPTGANQQATSTGANQQATLNGAYQQAVRAATSLSRDSAMSLMFSIMLGTNDSADSGTNGAGASPDTYKTNMKTIVDSLLARFPDCKIVLQYPIYYTPNTYNGARYMETGLQRLQSFFPEIKSLTAAYKTDHPGQVFEGDTSAFHYFREHYLDLCKPEQGRAGTFYLHPNQKGAALLGKFWGKTIRKALR
jgi:lysophospholipase L1-like esterase